MLTTVRSFLVALRCSSLFGGAVKRARAGSYREADTILRDVLMRLSSPGIDPYLPPVGGLMFAANILAAEVALELGDRERARETLRKGLAAWGPRGASKDGALEETLEWASTTLQTLDA